MNEKDFDLDFDFEKEYGFDTPEDTAAQQSGEDFDLKALLESEFGEEAAGFTSEYDSNFDYGPETVDYLQDEDMPIAQEPVEEEPIQDEFDAALPEEMMSSEPLPEEEPVEVAEQEPEQKPVRRERRKPVSPMRRFKNETLPLIITGVTALLIVVFVIGSLSRLIVNIKNSNDAALDASQAAVNEEQRQAQEAQNLLDEAALLAAGYDYDAAISKLEGFTGSKEKYPDIEIRLSEYKQQKSLLVAHNDPAAIPNLSFHVLIADPSRAWTDQEFGTQYNKNFVTTDEFEKILQQLYDNGYVLVDMDSFIAETVTGETITYSSKSLYLPDGKKPFMLTETMVNYFNYMIDGNDDGVADKDGAGFASKLVLQNGEIKAQMVNSTGETVVGNYDLVPILEDFIEAHPDFSYQGSRALLAVTGHEGVFGYRTNKSVIDTKGQAYYDAEVAEARKIAAALKEAGYEFASYTYKNEGYGDKNASEIQTDINNWVAEVSPILGSCDTLVYAKTSDISASGDYSNSKFNVLYNAGFRYFISHTTGNPACKVAGNYVRQLRVMVTGTQMAHAANTYSKYFDAQSVLNDTRGNVPQ